MDFQILRIKLSVGMMFLFGNSKDIYNPLSINDNAIWSLLLASGYLTVVNYIGYGDAKLPENCMPQYELKITNYETKLMFNELVKN